MTKLLFNDDEMDIYIGLKEKPKVPDLLPSILLKKEQISGSGAFFIKDGNLFTNIILEFDVNHPRFREYINKLRDFVKECEQQHILKSSSGI
jgi:hypothetical protein